MSSPGSTQTLPQRTASLDTDGISKLIAQARTNPQQTAQAITLLKSDPRSLITHLFRLSPEQTAALSDTSDAQLQQMVQPVIDGLQNHLSTLKVTYGWTTPPSAMPDKAQPNKGKGSTSITISRDL